jgi:aminopeptidase-like protein
MITNKIYNIGKKIFPINRSITGVGTRKTLKILKSIVPQLKIKKINAGEKVFDWAIPSEWNVNEAFIKDKYGKKIIDIKTNNLHLVGYSEPVHCFLKKKKLLKRINSLKKQPNAIPYITSYYKKYWGFCSTENQKKNILKDYKNSDIFEIKIDSNFNKNGELNYGEIIIPGKSRQEILVSTYICHPQMANNELSGPLVSIALAKYFFTKKNKKTIRFIFTSETIGAIAYIQKNLELLKRNVVGGYVLTCIGDEKNYSLLTTKYKNTNSDFAAIQAFKKYNIKYKTYSFLNRGSDERQYNSPGVDLPIASILRTKYGEYPEYHTSLDDFKLVTKKGLNGGFKIAKESILNIMNYIIPQNTVLCEPQLQKRNLYESLSTKKISKKKNNSRQILNFLQYADGKNNLETIGSLIKLKIKETLKLYKILKNKKLIIN